MSDWRTRLRTLVEHGEELPEPLDFFAAPPPSGEPWPEGLPPCPLLEELYAIADGGRFHPYVLDPLDGLETATDEVFAWAGDGAEAGLAAGRWIVFGGHDEVDSHVLVWDAAADRVGLYSADNGWIFDDEGGWPFIPCTLARFLEALFSPSADSRDELEREWARALDLVDRMT